MLWMSPGLHPDRGIVIGAFAPILPSPSPSPTKGEGIAEPLGGLGEEDGDEALGALLVVGVGRERGYG